MGDIVQFNKVNVMFKHLMEKNNLTKEGWNMHYSGMSTFSSKTDHHIKRIKLSKYYIVSSSVSDTDIMNTILNEISKALVSGKFSTIRDFNKAWKMKCKEIGGTPKPVCDPFVDREYYPFHLKCKEGCFVGRMRMNKKEFEKEGCYECVKHSHPLKAEKNKEVKQLEF